jgi:hypothetical protein
VVEHLSSNCEDPSSNSSGAKTEQKQKLFVQKFLEDRDRVLMTSITSSSEH